MQKGELQLTTITKNEATGTSRKAVGFLDGYLLWWDKEITAESIEVESSLKLWRKIILAILSVFLLSGILSLAYFFFTFEPHAEFSFIDLLTLDSFFLQYSSITFIALLYLIYIVQSQKDSFKTVVQSSYTKEEDSAAPPQISTFDQLQQLPRSKRHNVHDSLNKEARDVIYDAYTIALRYKHARVETLHIVLASITSSRQVATLIYRLGINAKDLIDMLVRLSTQYEFDENRTLFDSQSESIAIKSYKKAYANGMEYVHPVELFETAVLTDESILEIFYDLKVEKEDISNAAQWLRINQMLRERYQRYASAGKLRSKYGIDRARTSLGTKFLNSMSEDLTRLAQMGYTEIVVDRQKEIRELYRIFESGTRNVLLVGPSGSGKNAIVSGLAEKIIGNDVPKFLREKRIVSLSISSLVSGATPSEAQGRLLNALGEAVQGKNVVLHIDNLQDLRGISGGQGLDLSDVLAEVLQKNLLYFIGTVDSRSYAQFIEGTPLGNVLKKVSVNEMDEDAVIQVLEAKTALIENKQQVVFSYQALKAIVQYTNRYVHDISQPTKSIDVLEEVAVYVRNAKGVQAVVQSDDVARLLTEKLGIPIEDVSESESKKLLNIEDILHERVIGQDEAVKAVAIALKRARTELRDPNRPIANLLFLGSTGVGKTELAKAIAEAYFGNEDSMVRLDMSEYQNQSDVYKMIGAPTGTGGQQEGILTEAIRKNPYTIVLLDELEKAHRDVINVFLQVMEDGRLTDAAGRTVDFTNTIIIATSNAGTQFIQDKLRQGLDVENIKQGLLEGELNEYFRPEFINRFDKVVVFKPLTQEEVVQIAGLMMQKVANQLENKGIQFRASKEAIQELAEKGFDPVYGARPLRRVIQDEVDSVIADFLLQGDVDRRDTLVLEKGGELKIEKAKKL